MQKKKTRKARMAKSTKMVPFTTMTDLGPRPAFIKPNDRRGTEDLTKDDMEMAVVKVAQALSPELIQDDPKYIEGLKVGDLFNTLTGTNYGRGPVSFSVLRREKPYAIEYYSREAGGGIKERDIPGGDPRRDFHGEEKPVATEFRDYVAVLWETRDWVTLRFKSSGLKVAKRLNAYQKRLDGPCFAGKYELTTKSDKKDKGNYEAFVVNPAGWVTDADEYKYAEQLHESLQGQTIVIEPDKDDL